MVFQRNHCLINRNRGDYAYTKRERSTVSVVIVSIALVLTACAQVPPQSVELSATIGRDLAETHRAHKELAAILFDRMRADINRFVDDVYAPYQINAAMSRQQDLANSDIEADPRRSLLLAVNTAFQDGADPTLQANVLRGFQIMVKAVYDDVEVMREELLTELQEQETEIMNAIERSYLQLHYANSIVTGHLASIVEVHDAQQEILEAIGVSRDLRTEVGAGLAQASDSISDLVEKSERAEENVDTAATKLKNVFSDRQNNQQ